MSIFGGFQPDNLTVYLEQAGHALANDGMLQRLQLLVYPDALGWEWSNRSPAKAVMDAALVAFGALVDFDPVTCGAAPADDFAKFPHYQFSVEAQTVFIEWSEDMHRALMPNEDEPIIRRHLAKFDKLFPALALVFHLVDRAAEGISGPVTKEAALRAIDRAEFPSVHADDDFKDALKARVADELRTGSTKFKLAGTGRKCRRNESKSRAQSVPLNRL